VVRGAWAIQLGAFADPDQARRMAESARSLAPAQLGSAQAVLGTTAPFGARVLYRARLAGLSWEDALAACGQLMAQRESCVAVPPGK
jgi:D-alanyl-D-alanine carboxypeptidase